MLTRFSSILGAAAVGGILIATTYAAPAAAPSAPAHHAPASPAHLTAHVSGHYRFVAPVPHKYRADGLRMGLHCESAAMSP